METGPMLKTNSLATHSESESERNLIQEMRGFDVLGILIEI
jgi:hypothetical protein